jgi:cell fate regulator YaaT (PSP1 superfamily)
MIDIVGIRFRCAGKVYHFNPNGLELKEGTKVVVETVRGVEYGTVVSEIERVEEKTLSAPLKDVIRIATEDDSIQNEDNKKKARDAFKTCKEKIIKHELDMKLIDVEYTFDNNKILFYFTADGRIDFRELVKDLAAVFRTRIELRQIGVRDETKMMGGIGICGRCLCCNCHLSDFQPVSIKMAKEQGLSLNPTKISGVCGRLMCCLKYEQNAYEEIITRAPKVGSIVDTIDGNGEVISISLLREEAKIRLTKEEETELKVYKINDLKVISTEHAHDADLGEMEATLEELKELED